MFNIIVIIIFGLFLFPLLFNFIFLYKGNRTIFDIIYPYLFRDKWERKRAKLICNKKYSVDFMKEFDNITKEEEKYNKSLLRKEKLKKLNNGNN